MRAAEENHCDLVIADFYRVVGERLSHKGDIEETKVMTREEFAGHMMENPADFYYGVLWNKLFRRELVERYRLRMDAAISWCEDFMFNLEYIRHAERFYAIQVPVYYYVKTKGSLVSQGSSISKTIKMKLMVFEYYNNFYKHVLDEEDYEKSRLQVYSFLVDAAGDGTVPPFLLPGSKKLGNERASVCQEAVAGEGSLMDAYRDRKLLEYYLEPVAIRYDMTLAEMKLFLCVTQIKVLRSRAELADFSGLGRSSLARGLQKLVSRGLLKIEEDRGSKASHRLKLLLQPAAAPVLTDLIAAQNDYDQARFADFGEDDLIRYAALSERMKHNMQKILQ